MTTRYQSNRKWWKDKTRGRELFFAVVDNGWPRDSKPRPENVDHEFSCGFYSSHRYYAFATKEQRDEFVLEWDSASATEDPVND